MSTYYKNFMLSTFAYSIATLLMALSVVALTPGISFWGIVGVGVVTSFIIAFFLYTALKMPKNRKI